MHGKFNRIHFVGIGGIGMCGIAELLAAQGHSVTGSDLREGPTVARLRALGIDVAIGHDAANVGLCDAVVFSSAIRPDNAELARARELSVPLVPRGEMLAECMRGKRGVAVAGSHGKTTTSSLISHVLECAKLDPTSVIGGRVTGAGREPSGVRLGASDLLIAEADESDGSFLRLTPSIAVVTNIDAEHLDHYGDYAAVQDAFARFAESVPFWGLAVLCRDHPGVAAIAPRLTRRVATYGLAEGEAQDAGWRASDLRRQPAGTRFAVSLDGSLLGEVALPLPGRHNVQNALAAIAVAHELEVPFAVTAAALASFGGVERRFERKGSCAGVAVVDDYAHHPAELIATLDAAREGHAGRIVAVFQPHRFTRTRDCWDGFAAAFEAADRVVVASIYPAGEDPIEGIDAERLSDAIRATGHPAAEIGGSLDQLADELPATLEPGDLVLTLGAGDVSNLGPRLLERLSEKTRQEVGP